MKRRGSIYRLAWAGALLATTGLALPVGFILRARGAHDESSEVERAANDVARLAGLLGDSSSGGESAVPTGAPGTSGSVSDDKRRDDEATVIASSSSRLRGDEPNRVLSPRDEPAPGAIVSDVVLTSVTPGPSAEQTGPLLRTSAGQVAPGAGTLPATVRMQDEELAAAGAAEAGEGISLLTVGAGVLAAGGIAAATVAIIETTADPASP